MEIFQTIWTALTTPNAELTNLLIAPLAFIEIPIVMLLFTTFLNIETTKKQRYTYIFIVSFLSVISNLFIKKEYIVFTNMLIIPISVMCIFKVNILKGFFSLILPSIITILLDTIIAKICLLVFNISREYASIIPLYRIIINLIMYLMLYIVYILFKNLKCNINILDNINKKNKLVLIVNSIIGCLAIATQFYLIGYYNEILPIFITVLSLLSLITYFIISLYSLTKTTQLQITEQNLEEAQLYNKSLKILHDNVRAFKHDFSNIVQAIGRLCWN